ncbi:acyl-protein synthetase [uncultured Selenomonas sp.]|uniref:LuxE/PaaK family acyltransferase n=1 Tax=uncultured Selenomonas sp. TaxID=159275 RepID=UPI0025CBAD7D|nr:acyl-protein synthetase [uncultured Selenomonas sp.]
MTYEEILQLAPYGVARAEKQRVLADGLRAMTEHHRAACEPYRRMTDTLGWCDAPAENDEAFPFLPVRLFKEMELRSVPPEDVFKVMTSSGTTGQQVSRIFLDRATAANQQKTLVRIVSDFTGSARLPMILIDCPSVVRNRAMFTARGAGILGFSIFGREKIYALDDEMQLDFDSVRQFLEAHAGEKILLFGFTFMIWRYFYQELVRRKAQGETLDLSNAILIHGGGWKKMAEEAVDARTFNAALKDVCGLPQVANYYGMVEQTGCIYMECPCGHLHASTYSDIIVRRPRDFSVAAVGEEGILEVVSLLPHSYPGHALLTEDAGVLLGEDDCPCGRKGKYFTITGRLKNAEIRGCSDTYADKISRN